MDRKEILGMVSDILYESNASATVLREHLHKEKDSAIALSVEEIWHINQLLLYSEILRKYFTGEIPSERIHQ